MDGYNTQVRQSPAEQVRARAEVQAGRAVVNQRMAAFEAFAKGGGA